MPRRPRPLDRDGGRVRDASLIVIASEDHYAVAQYFARFHCERVKVVVLPTEDSCSAPNAVLERIKKYENEYEIGEGDSLWLCLDTDHWAKPGHIRNLHAVLAESHKRGFQVAITCPCFEFWLLLHYTNEPLATLGIEASTSATIPCDKIGDAIRIFAGCYNKTRVDLLPLTEQQVRDAMHRAAAAWYAPVGQIPDQPSTGVHRILDAIDARQAFSFL